MSGSGQPESHHDDQRCVNLHLISQKDDHA